MKLTTAAALFLHKPASSYHTAPVLVPAPAAPDEASGYRIALPPRPRKFSTVSFEAAKADCQFDSGHGLIDGCEFGLRKGYAIPPKYREHIIVGSIESTGKGESGLETWVSLRFRIWDGIFLESKGRAVTLDFVLIYRKW